MRISKESYSLKQVEKLYGFARTAEVRSGGQSAVLFEQWLATGDEALLDGIELYNAEDCRSTYELHRLARSAQRPAGLAWRPPPEQREL